MRAWYCSVGIRFEDGELSVIGLRVGALLDRWCRLEWSKSSAIVGEFAGEDKKVRPGLGKLLVAGRISCTDRRFGTFVAVTGLAISQP